MVWSIDYISIAYAVIVAIGGVVGFLKAGSIASLVSGLAFSAVLGFGSFQTSMNPDNYQVSLITNIVLALLMGHRFYHNGYHLIPAGLITALSLLMGFRFGARGLGLPTF